MRSDLETLKSIDGIVRRLDLLIEQQRISIAEQARSPQRAAEERALHNALENLTQLETERRQILKKYGPLE